MQKIFYIGIIFTSLQTITIKSKDNSIENFVQREHGIFEDSISFDQQIARGLLHKQYYNRIKPNKRYADKNNIIETRRNEERNSLIDKIIDMQQNEDCL